MIFPSLKRITQAYLHFGQNRGKYSSTVCARSCVLVLPPHFGQQSQTAFVFVLSSRYLHLCLYQRAKDSIPVERPCRKTRNFLDRLADADAEARQNLADFPVGIRAVAVHDQRCQTVHHQPQIAKIHVRLLVGDMVNAYKRRADKFLQMQVLKELDVFLNNYAVSPKQYISYQRSAFFGKDNSDFRLTFDRQITARREDISLASGNYGSQIIRPDQRLMEIKVTDSIPKWLSDALSELNIYKTSFSKYGTAYKQYIRSKIEEDRSVMIYA